MRGVRAAKELLRPLETAEFREACRLSEEQIDVIRRISRGEYIRNSLSILRSFEMLAGYAYPKPKQDVGVEHSGVIVEVHKHGKEES